MQISETRLEIRPGRSIALELWPEQTAAANEYEYVVFMYHGSMACKEQYAALLAGLTAVKNAPEKSKNNKKSATTPNFMVVRYDAYGCGASDKPNDVTAYVCDELLADAVAIYDKYSNSSGNNIVMGHSFGTALVSKMHRELNARGPGSSPMATVLLGTSEVQAGYVVTLRIPLFHRIQAQV